MVYVLILIVLKTEVLYVLGVYFYDAGDGMDVTAGTVLSLQVSLALHCLQLKFFRGVFLNDERVVTEYICLEKMRCC